MPIVGQSLSRYNSSALIRNMLYVVFTLGERTPEQWPNLLKTHKTAVLSSIFQGYEGPAFAVRLWDGWQWSSSASQKPACTIVLENPKALASFIAEPNEITLGEAFVRGDLDVEGDIFAAFSIAEHLFNRPRRLRQQIVEKFAGTLFGLGQWFRHGSRHSLGRDRASISYHYDQPIAFYQPWLGKSFAYSCAYFRAAEDSLDVAQEQKLELVCQKLRLQPGERFLGHWMRVGRASLARCRQAPRAGPGNHSQPEQAETAKRRIEQAGLEHGCSVELRDYRELEAAPPTVRQNCQHRHVRACRAQESSPVFRDCVSAPEAGRPFSQSWNRPHLPHLQSGMVLHWQYVFPDGRLVTLSQTLSAAESQGLEVRDVENLGNTMI